MFLLVPAYPGCPGSKAVKRSLLLLQHNIQNMLNLQTCNAFVLAVYVVVKYFLFLICMCVSAVVATIVVQHLYLCSESKPLVPMHTWVCKTFIYTVVFPLSLKVLSNGV